MRSLVVTRVAIRFPTLPPVEWVTRRLDMIRQVAAPSVVASPAVWAWRTAVEHCDQVRAVAASLDPSPLVVLEDQRSDDRVWPGEDRLLTYRLDSDDAYLPEVFAVGPVADVVSFDEGWQWDITTGQVAPRRYPGGPFLAVATTRETMFDTGGPHGHVRHGRDMVRIPDPMWVQTVHGANLSTSWQGAEPLTGAEGRAVLARAGITDAR